MCMCIVCDHKDGPRLGPAAYGAYLLQSVTAPLPIHRPVLLVCIVASTEVANGPDWSRDCLQLAVTRVQQQGEAQGQARVRYG